MRKKESSSTAKKQSTTKEALPIEKFRNMSLRDSQEKTRNNPSILKTQSIHFTQASVSNDFTDGRSVAELTRQLIHREIKPEDINPIRVVRYKNNWMSLDNRRLRAFKDAFIDEIPVEVCNFDEQSIKREFYGKYSNKSSNDGGTLRSSAPTASKHFDDGAYKFIKYVLTWTLEKLKNPLPELRDKELASQFDPSVYYESFLTLILEEARASLQAGIEAIENKKIKPLNVSLLQFKPAKNPQNISVFKFSHGFRNTHESIKPYDAFVLQLPPEEKETSPLQMLALASPSSKLDENEIHLKVIMAQDLQSTFSDALCTQETPWQMIPIGSLVTHMRMFDVCTLAPQIPWLNQLCSGQLNHFAVDATLDEEKEMSLLNEPQKIAVKRFLQMEQGIHLIQGPPGTGKTTTVIELLKILAKQQRRVLVCAPSNKAVHVLVERFATAAPKVPIILAGVEDKLPEDNALLLESFIHHWGQDKLEQVREMQKKLWLLVPDKIYSGNKEKVANNVSTAIVNILRLIADYKYFKAAFKKYGFLPTSKENLAQLKIHLSEYHQTICSDADLKNLLDQHFSAYDEINYKNLTEINDELFAKFIHLRHLLSLCIGILNNIELRLQAAIDNDSKQGIEGLLLEHSSIIFTTLSVSGRKAIREMTPVDDLLIDEAGQSIEPETLIPLPTQPKRCLLVGDPKQLPATVISRKAVELKLDRSLLWRLIEDCQQPYTMLTIQGRMHTEIRIWPSAQYYNNCLTDTEDIAAGRWLIPEMASAPACFAPYALVDVHGREIRVGHSFKNLEEAELITKVITHLRNTYHIDVAKRIGVISFYKAQVEILNNLLRPSYPGININTVDSFQGSENDFILISFVRAGGGIGFLQDFRRLNVALTRAKYALMMFAHVTSLEKHQHDIAKLIQNARERKYLFKQQEAEAHLKPQRPPEHTKKKPQTHHSKFFTQPTHDRQQHHAITNTNSISSAEKTHLKEEKISAANNHTPSQKKLPHAPATSQTASSKTNSLYKTQLCHFFSKSPAACHKGSTCPYAHGEKELRFI